jgi:serine/threonine protein kinase
MPAPTTAEEFLELVRKSGVVEDKRLDAYVDKLRAGSGLPAKASEMAGLLVHDACLLTTFQAEQLLLGKYRRFTIGKYKVLERLGVGGMGSVYLCEHKLMRRRVAVKVLPTAKSNDPASLERFFREARAVAALDHPNIVRAYDIDQDVNLHFLVMEYVDGASLQEMVKKTGPMDYRRAVHYMRMSGLGLQHAHDFAGLVHRDIKPGNILVDRYGAVKVLDMGLARFFHDEEDILTKKYDENVLGTADYLAPEQALDSHSVDIRADIYSLGATFYFCLTGRTPFSEGTVAQKLIWHQTRQPKPVRATHPDVPEELAAILEKMMAKEPALRYQTPADVVAALAPWDQTPIPPPPDEEMPKLSPAALGLTSNEGAPPSQGNGGALSQPSSGRRNWKVVSGPGSRPPSAPSRPASAPPTAPSAKPSAGDTRKSTSKAPAAPTQPAVAATVTKPVPAAPRAAEEEGDPWEHLAPDTEDPSARVNTPSNSPNTRKKAPSASHRALKTAVAEPTFAERKRYWIVVGSVAGVVLLALVALLIYAFSGASKDDKKRGIIHIRNADPAITLQALIEALEQAGPDTRIVVESNLEGSLRIDASRIKPGVTVEADPGKTIVWTAGANPASPLIEISAEGFVLRGFTINGNNEVNDLIRLTGRIPGATLSRLQLKGFKRAAVQVRNCQGESGRRVTISELVTPPDANAETPVAFDIDSLRPAPSSFLAIRNCRFDGTYTQPLQSATIKNATKVELDGNTGTGVK